MFWYLILNLSINLIESSFLSTKELWTIPKNLTLYSSWLSNLTNVGNSFAQGGHDGYQKLITIGVPINSYELNSPPLIS